MHPAVHAHTCTSGGLRAMLGVVSQALPALFSLSLGRSSVSRVGWLPVASRTYLVSASPTLRL